MATRAVSHSRPAGRARRKPAARGAVLRRRVVAGVILIVTLYAGYMFWFRDLSWFAIHDVTIDGATTNEREIKSAVERVAGGMTANSCVGKQVVATSVAACGFAGTAKPQAAIDSLTNRSPVAAARARTARC